MPFASIHVYDGEPQRLRELCPGFSCGRLAGRWATLADPRLDWGGGPLLAGAVSLHVAGPVLFFDVAHGHPRYLLFTNGRCAAAQLPAGSFLPQEGEPVWLHAVLDELSFSSSLRTPITQLLSARKACTASPEVFADALFLSAEQTRRLWQAFGAEDEMEGAAILCELLQLPLFARPAQLER